MTQFEEGCFAVTQLEEGCFTVTQRRVVSP